MKPSAHVFVTCGDLTHLACDAWLVPTDVALFIGDAWERVAGAPGPPPPGWAQHGVRAFVEQGRAEDPRLRVWTNVGAGEGDGTAWFVDGAVEFVRVAAEALDRRAGDGASRAWRGRARPLVALPVVGSGFGGGADKTGDIVRTLLGALESAAQAHDVDICLVTRTDRAHAAAQAVRRTHGTATFDDNLTATQRRIARDLARRAVDGDLVLFLGAGVGAGAGLPEWNDLLTHLARSVGYSEAEVAELTSIHTLDRGRLIQARCAGGQQELAARVCAMLSSPWRSLAHTLLASLPVREAASTNYDQLFEQASADAGRPVAVLPYEPSRDRARWVLKLHGCVSHPADIVLTRDDYLRFAERRAALAGVVQALLVTRHMLFVGFSLTDDNFHRIVHDVRQALGHSTGGQARFGTALLLDSGPLVAELWKGDLDIVSMAEGQDIGREGAARRVEILLDYVGMLAADSTPHLLDETFAGALTDAERALAAEVRTLQARLPDEAWTTPAGRRLAGLLGEWGLRRPKAVG